MDFDIRTAVFLGATLSLLIGLLLALVVRDFPESVRPSLSLWTRGTVLLPLGFLLLTLRGVWPDLLTVLLANLLLVVAFGYYVRAVLCFRGLPHRAQWTWLLAGATIPGLWWFTYVDPQLTARAAMVSAALAVEVGAVALVMWRMPAIERGRGAWASISLFTVAAAFLAYRAGYFALFPESLAHPFQTSAMQLFSFAAGALLPLVGTFGFLLLCVDRARRELETAATTDFLTGLCNRRAIGNFGTQAFARARRTGAPLAVLVLDLDHFKRINDAFGHAAGDTALREIAAVLRASVRADETLGRLGGEEFVILLEDTDAATARRAAERVRQQLAARRIDMSSESVHVTASVGVAVLTGEDHSFDDVLQRADRAMYEAKTQGRNCVVTREPIVRQPLMSVG